MKNNRGFTLVELIVMIVLIATMAGLFTINSQSNLRRVESEIDNENYETLKSATKAYIYANTKEESIKVLLRRGGNFNISVDTLKKSGFLNSSFEAKCTNIAITKSPYGDLLIDESEVCK